jgi:hypothetical protein
VVFHWPDTEWGNRDTAVFMDYSGMLQGLGNSGSGKALPAGQLGPVLDRTFVKEAPPLGDDIAGALLDAAACFTVAELEEAGEVAFEAKLEGSVGDRYGEPAYDRQNCHLLG